MATSRPEGRNAHQIWSSRLTTIIWALWTATRASAAYVSGRIDGDEWHTRVGIARVAIGRDEPDLREMREDGTRGH